MFYTDNPIADAERHFAQQEKELERLPECYECGKPIQEEHCFEINGEHICERCLNDNHRVCTEDLTGVMV